MNKRKMYGKLKLRKVNIKKIIIFIFIIFISISIWNYSNYCRNIELSERQEDFNDSKYIWYYFNASNDQLIANTSEEDFLDKLTASGATSFNKVPVPVGFSASQIDETIRLKYNDYVNNPSQANSHITNEVTYDHGFVIYSGDVDWDSILDGNDTRNISMPIASVTNITNEEVVDACELYYVEEPSEYEGVTESTKPIISFAQYEALQEDNQEFATSMNYSQEEINIYLNQRQTNQYIFVPIDDVLNVANVDKSGRTWSKLYAQDKSVNNWTQISTNVLKIDNKNTGINEPRILGTMSNSFKKVDRDSLKYAKRLSEVNKRIDFAAFDLRYQVEEELEAIKKLGGIYVARYETTGTRQYPTVRKLQDTLSGLNWYEAYSFARNIENSDQVQTSIITRGIWEQICNWYEISGTKNAKGTDITTSLVREDSHTIGNYYDSNITYISANNLNENNTKSINESVKLQSGSTSCSIINNLADISGNLFEWNLAAYNGYQRMLSGGNCSNYGNNFTISNYYKDYPYTRNDGYGFRTVLY